MTSKGRGVVPPACCIERVLRSGTAWGWRCVAETSLRLGGHPTRYSYLQSTFQLASHYDDCISYVETFESLGQQDACPRKAEGPAPDPGILQRLTLEACRDGEVSKIDMGGLLGSPYNKKPKWMLYNGSAP